MSKFTCLVLVLLAGCASPYNNVVNDISDSSVMVVTSKSSGSGTAVRNGKATFVWTVGHVIEPIKSFNKVLNQKTQATETKIKFDDVILRQTLFDNGRKIGEYDRYGRVLRVSPKHDIALLEIYGDGWPLKTVELLPTDRVVERSEDLWHVGNMHGPAAPNSLSKILFSNSGLLRNGTKINNLSADTVAFDHYTGVAHRGSSGGGIFNQSGQLVGMVSQFAHTDSLGSFLGVPSWRIRAFAKQYNCEWAVDKKIPFKYNPDDIIWVDDIVISDE
jgi:hypothetical protein